MGLRLTYPLGATPLDPDEAEGLIPRHISTQGQLNEWELQNILEGQQWAFTRRPANLLTIDFMQSLHKRMFGNTWHWAGTLRITEKSIGVAPEFISVRLRDLCDDIGAQQEYRSFPPREIAARFHHRLVFIHPFPNGNGRFSRLMTDLLLEEFGELAGDKSVHAILLQHPLPVQIDSRAAFEALRVLCQADQFCV